MNTSATIHIVTRDKRRGDVLWDAVWCADCVAGHKAAFATDKTIEITERPWSGALRPCDSCDDSENAPEFRGGR